MTGSITPRVHRGVPAGGQFAARDRNDGDGIVHPVVAAQRGRTAEDRSGEIATLAVAAGIGDDLRRVLAVASNDAYSDTTRAIHGIVFAALRDAPRQVAEAGADVDAAREALAQSRQNLLEATELFRAALPADNVITRVEARLIAGEEVLAVAPSTSSA